MTGEAPKQNEERRFLFAGGGTGGHVYMAVALGHELQRRHSNTRVLFVGTTAGLEARILPPLGFPLETIRVGGLNRVGAGRQLRTLMQLPGSFLDSYRIVRRFAPRVVVGLGGYSSGPVVVVAKFQGRRVLLIEPNVLPGLTNRWLARVADRSAVAFDETVESMGPRSTVTGIPIRQAFHEVPAWSVSEGPLRLLIFGGSRGSRPINKLVCESLRWLSACPLRITHQTGADDLEWVAEAYRRAGREDDRVTSYLDEMHEEMAQADLIISRAGASTVAEISAAGRASILIPFPAAADDHQRRNAQALQEREAALLAEQSDLDGEKLACLVRELESDRERLARMADSARRLARRGSTAHIADMIESLGHDR